MKLLKDFNLTENFKMNEFLAPTDSGDISVEDYVNLHKLADKLQSLRDIVGAITVNSGYRSPQYNNQIKGSLESYHTEGLAVDIKFNWGTWKVDTLLKVANYLGFTNIGLYLRKDKFIWLHLDIGKPWGDTYGWSVYSDTMSYKVYEV